MRIAAEGERDRGGGGPNLRTVERRAGPAVLEWSSTGCVNRRFSVAAWEEHMTDERTGQKEIEELLNQEQYTPDELALLLNMDVGLIRHSAFSGELTAMILDHHIVDIRREDVLRWLSDRG